MASASGARKWQRSSFTGSKLAGLFMNHGGGAVLAGRRPLLDGVPLLSI